MIKNYILLFVRNLQRQKLFSVINLLGLTVSIASTLIIYLYVAHEFSYDSFHPNVHRLYRVNQTFIWSSDGNTQFSRTGPGVAHALKEELPEVELISSFHTPGDFIISYVTPKGDVLAFEENKILAADSNFFKVFNYPLIQGDEASAFKLANTLVMTKSTAKKYFGDKDPVGKLVQLSGLNGEGGTTYEVTGVLDDTPGQLHDGLRSVALHEEFSSRGATLLELGLDAVGNIRCTETQHQHRSGTRKTQTNSTQTGCAKYRSIDGYYIR